MSETHTTPSLEEATRLYREANRNNVGELMQLYGNDISVQSAQRAAWDRQYEEIAGNALRARDSGMEPTTLEEQQRHAMNLYVANDEAIRQMGQPPSFDRTSQNLAQRELYRHLSLFGPENEVPALAAALGIDKPQATAPEAVSSFNPPPPEGYMTSLLGTTAIQVWRDNILLKKNGQSPDYAAYPEMIAQAKKLDAEYPHLFLWGENGAVQAVTEAVLADPKAREHIASTLLTGDSREAAPYAAAVLSSDALVSRNGSRDKDAPLPAAAVTAAVKLAPEAVTPFTAKALAYDPLYAQAGLAALAQQLPEGSPLKPLGVMEPDNYPTVGKDVTAKIDAGNRDAARALLQNLPLAAAANQTYYQSQMLCLGVLCGDKDVISPDTVMKAIALQPGIAAKETEELRRAGFTEAADKAAGIARKAAAITVPSDIVVAQDNAPLPPPAVKSAQPAQPQL